MSKKKRNPGRAVRDAPTQSMSSGASFLTSVEGWNILCGNGYKPVWKCPEETGFYQPIVVARK